MLTYDDHPNIKRVDGGDLVLFGRGHEEYDLYYSEIEDEEESIPPYTNCRKSAISHFDKHETITEWDKYGNIVYYKEISPNLEYYGRTNIEYWAEYNDRQLLEFFKEYYEKEDRFVEYHFKYDENDNLIYQNVDGRETFDDYDDKGRLIHIKNPDGFEVWQEYDKRGNIIHVYNSKGGDLIKEFDTDGKLLSVRGSDGYEEIYQYNENGRLVYYKQSNRNNHNEYAEHWHEYDDQNREIHGKSYFSWKDETLDVWFTYHENGRLASIERSSGLIERYDENGKRTHYETQWYKVVNKFDGDRLSSVIRYHKNEDGAESIEREEHYEYFDN